MMGTPSTTVLADARSRFVAQGASVDLESALGQHTLLESLRAVLGPTPTLAAASTSDADEQGNFTVTATTRWLHLEAQRIEFRFFATSGPAESALHCLLRLIDAVPTWNITSDFPDLPGYVDLSPEGIAQGLQTSFLATVDMSQVAFSFSSFDWSQPATIPHDGAPPHVGIAFTGSIDAGTGTGVWATVGKVAGIPLGRLPLAGAITRLTGAPVLDLECAVTGATLELSREVALSLTALEIRSGLSKDSSVGPTLGFRAQLTNPLHPLGLRVNFAVGSRAIAIEAAFDDGGVFAIEDLAGLLGLDPKGLIGALPGGAAFGALGLRSLAVDATVDPPGLDRVQLMVTTEQPWVIVDDLVTVKPMLIFHVDNRTAQTTLDLAGLWRLGTSELEVAALIDTGDVVARLSPGSTLDVSALTGTLLPGVQLPSIDLVDLDVRLNYLSRTFSLAVEAATSWVVPLGVTQLEIENVRFDADYGGGRITHVGMGGRLKLSQLRFDLQGDYAPEGSSIRGEAHTDAPLDVGTMINDLQRELTGQAESVAIPPDLLQLDIASAFVDYRQADQELRVGADVTHVLELGSAFSIDEFALELAFVKGSLEEAEFLTHLTICGVELVLRLTKGDAGWRFEGATGVDQELRLGELITDLAAKFGTFEAPAALRDLTVSNLSLAFDTDGSRFDFGCTLKAPVGDQTLEVHLEIALTRGATGFEAAFAGSVTIAGLKFELLLEAIRAAATEDAAQASSSLLLAAVQPGQKIDVRALVAAIDTDAGSLMPAATIDLTNALLIYHQAGSAPANWLVGLALGLEADLSQLPVVGSVFADQHLGGIRNIQILYASGAVAADDVTRYNQLLGKAGAKPPLPIAKEATGTTTVLKQGFNFSAGLELGGTPLLLGAGGDTAPADPTEPPANTPAVSPPSGNASWFDVKKSIGAVTLARVGVRYEGGRVWLLLDADFVIAGISLELQGLALGMALSDLRDIAVNLDGMAIDFTSGPLTIAGGFLRIGGDYLGMARVRAGWFSLTAVGGYAPAERSFFIFVRLAVPLGGPPFFFVTGLAGGFGVNRTLTIPPVDELAAFPLLPANNTFPTKLDGDPGKSLAETIRSTAGYLAPSPGQNWAAVGIDFRSFEMVDCSALVTVAFGVEFALSLLGICRLDVPKGDPEPIVHLEVALVAQFKPAQGVLAVDGRITPASYLFSRQCRITGGFAFHVWFAGEHEGDFVISLGGYHPRFEKPDHYPVVPRMQLVYKLDGLVLKGQTYLALTPHMVMAGMLVEATWSSGSIKAWFNAGIDFLLKWQPFHYEADAFIHIGVSLNLDLLFTTVSLTVHLGVDLSVWGPPFGGRATIDLSIVSFTIAFGESPRHATIDWHGFKDSFLPAGRDGAATPDRPERRLATAAVAAPSEADGLLCTAAITDGLLQELKAKDEGEFFSWLVDADHFAIDSTSLIPAKQATYNEFDLQMPFTASAGFVAPASGAAPTAEYDETAHPNGVSWSASHGVLPMGLTADQFTSHHTVRVRRLSRGADYRKVDNYTEPVDDVAVGPLVKRVAAALWAPKDPGLNGERLMADSLVGLRVAPKLQRPDVTLKADLWSMMFDQNQEVSCRSSAPRGSREDPYHATTDGTSLSFQLSGETITNSDHKLAALTLDGPAAVRSGLIDALDSVGFDFDTGEVDVTGLAGYPLWDWPMIRTLGAEVAP